MLRRVAMVMAVAALAFGAVGLVACDGGSGRTTGGTLCTGSHCSNGNNPPVVNGPPVLGNPGNPSSDPEDMAHSPFSVPDLASTGTKFGCHGFTQCYIDCFNTNPSASGATCQSTCAAQSQASAQTAFSSALSCGQSYCLGSGTGYKCKLDASGTSIVNMDGTAISSSDPQTGNTGTKDCGQCLNDALAKLFGDACVTSGTDCSTALSGGDVTACGSTTNACLSSLP